MGDRGNKTIGFCEEPDGYVLRTRVHGEPCDIISLITYEGIVDQIFIKRRATDQEALKKVNGGRRLCQC